MKKRIFMAVMAIIFALPVQLPSYPIDGYPSTGIRRLLRLQMIENDEIKEKKLLKGALKTLEEIELNLLEQNIDTLLIDPALQKQLNALFGGLSSSYSLTLLDITPGRPVRYAERQEDRGFQPGSVGKLAVATGLFCQLESIFPDSFSHRQQLLKERMVKAGQWALPNEHTVPFFNPETKAFNKRTLIASDVFSLYEWADHMLSVSSNGAASVVWREAILMYHFGQDYLNLSEEEANTFFKNTPKSKLSEMAIEVVNEPLRALGISKDEWRLGSLFTRGGKTMIPGEGGSIGTPYGLMKFLVALESGKVIDPASSLEIKRLMYMTDRRIRYAASAVLNDAAVYFKSGSLYKCKPEPGYECAKYKGNVDNFMNSVAIIEHPDSTTYLVALMSNVLKKNSNIDHNALAGQIDKLVRTRTGN